MPLVKINSGAIVDSTIIADDLANASVNGPKLGIYSVSGNNIANGAISSNTLGANLSFSMIRVTETANLFSTAPSGNINIDVLSNTVYYFSSNTTSNVTFNLRGNSTTRLDAAMAVGDSISVAMALRHANTTGGRHIANVAIDGGYISTTRANPDVAAGNLIYFAGNTAPGFTSTTQGFELNMFGVTVIKRAANSYLVLQSNTLFGLG